METLGFIVSVIGILVAVVGSIWLLVAGFGESILWGLGMIFIPFVALIFILLHWDKAGKPFLVNLAGGAIMFVGYLMQGGAA